MAPVHKEKVHLPGIVRPCGPPAQGCVCPRPRRREHGNSATTRPVRRLVIEVTVRDPGAVRAARISSHLGPGSPGSPGRSRARPGCGSGAARAFGAGGPAAPIDGACGPRTPLRTRPGMGRVAPRPRYAGLVAPAPLSERARIRPVPQGRVVQSGIRTTRGPASAEAGQASAIEDNGKVRKGTWTEASAMSWM